MDAQKHKYMKGFFPIFLLTFFFFAATSHAQSQDPRISSEDWETMHTLEDTIALLAYAIVNDSLPEHRFGATKKMIPTLVEALKHPNSFYYPFERVKTVSVLYPPDSTFRIFTWQLYVDQEDYRYYGAIQMNNGEKLQLFPLIDRSQTAQDVEQEVYQADNWYGALYYRLFPFETAEGTSYLLFGYDGYSFYTKRKLVDVLHFRNNKPHFGSPVFVEPLKEGGQRIRHRLVLNYSAESSIKLNYDDILGMIVFDHLMEIGHIGGPVPDGTYEGYRYQDGYWLHQPKIFHEILEEPPRPEPVFDDKNKVNLFGKGQ